MLSKQRAVIIKVYVTLFLYVVFCRLIVGTEFSVLRIQNKCTSSNVDRCIYTIVFL